MRFFVIDASRDGTHLRAFRRAAKTVDHPTEADALVVFGGDGAMLSAIQEYMDYGKPFIGVNAGTRGFLMNNAPDIDCFTEVLPRLRFQDLWLLEGRVRTHEADVRIYGFNDVWVERASAQTLRMRITVDAMPQPPRLVGDGILFATPQGSTGYNLALRGKPICPQVPVLQVTPMSCVIDKSPVGSLILSDQSEVAVDFEQTDKRPGRLFYDGIKLPAEPILRLHIKRADRNVQVGFVDEYSCFNKVLPWQLHF